MTGVDVRGAVARAHREEWARVVAALTRRFGDLDLAEEAAAEPVGVIDDDRLRLIFTCCRPALAMDARVVLTLRMFGGLTVPR